MLEIKQLGLIDYTRCWHAMQKAVTERNAQSLDQLWLLQHPPVFTQGVAGKPEHLLNANGIPVVQSDRGGQITYHGPGQLVAYNLLNLSRFNIGPKGLVRRLEDVIISLLSEYQINGQRRTAAPGIYVDDRKIASIGLRIRNGYSYHGIAFNVDMDLTPFNYINPCGYAKLKVTQLSELTSNINQSQVLAQYVRIFMHQFNFTTIISPAEEAFT